MEEKQSPVLLRSDKTPASIAGVGKLVRVVDKQGKLVKAVYLNRRERRKLGLR